MSTLKTNPHGIGNCPKCGAMEYDYGYDTCELQKDEQGQWIAVEYVRCFNRDCKHTWQNVFTYAGYQEKDS